MPYKPLLPILLTTILCYANWETIGGNSQRTSFLDVIGPESKDEILWEGSLESLIGLPILISGNKLITSRVFDPNLEYAPIVCHNLHTGDTIWTKDFPGTGKSISTTIGFKGDTIYSSNWTSSTANDSLYAINSNTGEFIWRSEVTILGAYDLGVAFSDNGDIILPSYDSISRINHTNGGRIWSTERIVPVIPAYSGLSIHQNTIYGWHLGLQNELEIIAIDAQSGSIKYGIEIPKLTTGGYATGPLPVIDTEGMIYVHKANDNIVKIEDTKTELKILWAIPIDKGGVTKPALGPDNTLYFTNRNKIMSANPNNGNIIDSSMEVWQNDSMSTKGNFAIDRYGHVFFNNMEDQIFCFSNDLDLIWSDTVENISHGGPALSDSGLLAIAGGNNELKVYKRSNTSTDLNITKNPQINIKTFISKQNISIEIFTKKKEQIKLYIYNLKGQLIYKQLNLSSKPGRNVYLLYKPVFIHRSQIYTIKMFAGNHIIIKKLVLLN